MEKIRGSQNWVREKLDRALASNSLWHRFPLCKLTVFYTTKSDHDSIFFELLNVTVTKKNFRFRFENTWLKEPSFHSEVEDFWRTIPTAHLLPKLIFISSFMAKWGSSFFHKFRDKVIKQKGGY